MFYAVEVADKEELFSIMHIRLIIPLTIVGGGNEQVVVSCRYLSLQTISVEPGYNNNSGCRQIT